MRLPEEAEVAIVGGGPVGLALAGLLGGFGVRTVLLERHASTSTHPRGFGIHPRTMEAFRRIGVADAIRAAGLPPQEAAGFGFVTQLAGGERARLMLEPMPDHLGPEQGCFCPQGSYEAVLRDHAAALPDVEVVFGAEVSGLAGDRLEIDGVPGPRAPWIVAADGMRSPLRKRLGATETTTGALAHAVSLHIRADLRRFRHGRPFALTWTIDPGCEGTFGLAAADGTEWTFTFIGDQGRDYSHPELVEKVRQAVGDPGVEVDVLGVLRWDYEHAVTDRWQSGQVLFCGDAAHRFPPHGGFGMNSGVQDAENLAWKLAAVLRWGASARLLESYEAERKPVAVHNGERALINTDRLVGASWEPDRASASLAEQHEHFLSLGQQMGVAYTSSAVVDDGSAPTPSTVTDYIESARPGARAPFIRFADGTTTVDACADGFVLLTESAAETPSEVPVRVLRGASDRPWQQVYGVSPTGSVLIRPDGHVAARVHDAEPTSAATALRAVLGQSSLS